jgi:hypothetical protein
VDAKISLTLALRECQVVGALDLALPVNLKASENYFARSRLSDREYFMLSFSHKKIL